jgi:hypothetical protein
MSIATLLDIQNQAKPGNTYIQGPNNLSDAAGVLAKEVADLKTQVKALEARLVKAGI